MDAFTRLRRWKALRALLLAAALMACVSACGGKKIQPKSAPPGKGPSQPLIWDSGTWDNNQWT
jgi:hypothetical protein